MQIFVTFFFGLLAAFKDRLLSRYELNQKSDERFEWQKLSSLR